MSETRKLVAILVADVVGYSRLAGADEERFLRMGSPRSRIPIAPKDVIVHVGQFLLRRDDDDYDTQPVK
jgi:adenylate cyclase